MTLEKKNSEGPFLKSALIYRGYTRKSEIEKTVKNLNKELKMSKNGLRFSNWDPSEIKEEYRIANSKLKI